MMISRCLLICLLFCSAAAAQTGRASVEWISASATAQAGKPMQTAIRMIHDGGWHSYWVNPGEAGMPTTVEWKLPPGWQVRGPEFPAPARFLTGGLAGYGYEGTTWLPVTLTPPEDFSGGARLTATISWLACGEQGCVPGEAHLQLDVRAGDPADGPEAAAIRQAFAKLPRLRDCLALSVAVEGKNLRLGIAHPADFTADLGACSVFPATPEVVDAQAEIRFTKSDGQWTAVVPRSGFAKEPPRQLTLVLSGGALETPLELSWNAP